MKEVRISSDAFEELLGVSSLWRPIGLHHVCCFIPSCLPVRNAFETDIWYYGREEEPLHAVRNCVPVETGDVYLIRSFCCSGLHKRDTDEHA